MVTRVGLVSLVQTPDLSLERREKISVPLRNGRLLSPPHERQREGERPSKLCRIKNVDAHRRHNNYDPADVEFDFAQVTSLLPNRRISKGHMRPPVSHLAM